MNGEDSSLEQMLAFMPEAYGITPRAVVALSRSRPASTFRLETSRGAYCLKRRRQGMPDEQLRLEESLLVQLAEQGFDMAPPLIPTGAGAYHATIGADRWCLLKFTPADPAFDWRLPTWEKQHSRQAGALTARFHHSASRCRLPSFDSPERTSRFAWLSNYMAQGIARLGQVRQQARQPALSRFSDMESNALVASAAAIARRLDDLEKNHRNPPIVLHGDLHPGNFLFRNGQAVAILDFEYLGTGSPALDLGYAYLTFARKDAGKDARWDNHAEEFLSGYLETAASLGFSSLVFSQLTSAGSAIDVLAPYMQLSCHIIIAWLLNELAVDASNQEELSLHLSALKRIFELKQDLRL